MLAHRRPVHAAGVVLSCALVAFAVASCSLLVRDGRCDIDGDCASRANGAGAVCRDGACIASSTGPSNEAGVVGECTVNTECVAKLGSEFAVCEKSQKKCVTLTSEDCTKIHGDYKNDNAILIGTLFRQGATAGDEGASPDALAAIELAFDEFKNARGGLPDPAGGTARPLVAVECNTVVDHIRAAKHLAENLRVPAIIGAASSYITIQVAEGVTKNTGTFLISPYASSPFLSTLPDNDLVWRTYPSDALQAKAIPRLVDEIIASPGFTGARPGQPAYRVGIVYKDDTYGQGLLQIVTETLRFNGKSAKQNQDEGNFATFSYPNTEDPAFAAYDFTQVASEVVSSGAPFDIVMLLGTSEATKVFSFVESQVPGGTAPPYYIMPDGIASAPSLALAIENIVKGGSTDSKSLRKRIRGSIVNVFSGPLFDAFSLKFSGFNAVNGSNAYDAAYVTAYALYGVGNAPLTGANVANAMKKLAPPGNAYNVGPNDIAPVLQGLAGGNITLRGTAGNLDFDLATGDVKATGAAIWCLSENASGKAVLITQTGQTYDDTSGQLVGAFPEGPNPDPCKFN